MSPSSMAAEIPKQRSIDFLSPEQLRRKRESDKKSQRQMRERTKAQIKCLETQVQELQTRNKFLEAELAATQSQNKVKRKLSNQTPPDDALCQYTTVENSVMANLFDVGRSGGDYMNGLGYMTSNWVTDFLEADVAHMVDGNNAALGTSKTGDTVQFPYPSATDPVPSCIGSPGPTQFAENVWLSLPKHTAATCLLDHVVTDLIQSRRQHELTGGNVQEFQKRAFPSVQSLLNPVSDILRSPVTSSIVRNIIHVMTVPTLPEQTAILYAMSSMIRWQISPTESNYDDMPDWLRPTPSQLIRPHPVWLDLFVWPKAREMMCRQPKYYNQHFSISKFCNESISINWPHQPSDMVLQLSSNDYILNPIFDRHIKNIDNWTVGRQILDVYVI